MGGINKANTLLVKFQIAHIGLNAGQLTRNTPFFRFIDNALLTWRGRSAARNFINSFREQMGGCAWRGHSHHFLSGEHYLEAAYSMNLARASNPAEFCEKRYEKMLRKALLSFASEWRAGRKDQSLCEHMSACFSLLAESRLLSVPSQMREARREMLSNKATRMEERLQSASFTAAPPHLLLQRDILFQLFSSKGSLEKAIGLAKRANQSAISAGESAEMAFCLWLQAVMPMYLIHTGHFSPEWAPLYHEAMRKMLKGGLFEDAFTPIKEKGK